VARGTIDADIKHRIDARERSLKNENSNQNPADEEWEEAEDEDGIRS
jgi:hypothetical protein